MGTRVVLTYKDYEALPADGRDPDGQTIEAYALAGDTHRVAARLAGAEPASLPPFPDLALDPTSLWR